MQLLCITKGLECSRVLHASTAVTTNASNPIKPPAQGEVNVISGRLCRRAAGFMQGRDSCAAADRIRTGCQAAARQQLRHMLHIDLHFPVTTAQASWATTPANYRYTTEHMAASSTPRQRTMTGEAYLLVDAAVENLLAVLVSKGNSGWQLLGVQQLSHCNPL